jgi:hypothetical protein
MLSALADKGKECAISLCQQISLAMSADANISTPVMDIPTPDELIAKIEEFIERHAMAETRFGRDAVRDPNLLNDLRAGRRLPGLTKLNAIADFIRAKDAGLAAADHAASDTIATDAASSGKGGEVSARQVAA